MIWEGLERWRERQHRRREIAEELEHHLELSIEENLSAGMEAREALEDAHQRFGELKHIYRTCCQIDEESVELANEDPVLTYSPLSVPFRVCLLVGLLAPASLLYFFAPHVVNPLPYRDADRVWTTAFRVPLVAEEPGDLSYVGWRENATVFDEMAVFAPLTARVERDGIALGELPGLMVSREFFRTLDVRPQLGEIFPAAMGGDGLPGVVISHELWKERLSGDFPIGETLSLNGRSFRVIGVTAPDFWFSFPRVGFWLLVEALVQSRPATAFVVGRLAAGAEPEQMASELQSLLGDGARIMLGRHLVSSGWRARRNLRAAVAVVLAALVVTFALGCLQVISLGRLVAPARLQGSVLARYYVFLLSKSFLVLLAPAALWIVLCERGFPSNGKWLPVLVPFVATMSFLLLCAAVVWWSLVDQRLRCPVCLQRLRMPVSLGTLGSILFDLPATEYICTHGHGTLHVPEPRTNEMEPTRWRSHGELWDELLVARK